MQVFSDFHQQDLFYSLQLLFEKRLGWNLYRPIGMDWYPDFWNVYPHIDTARQYLMDGFVPKDETPPLNGISRIEDGIHIMKDLHNGAEHKALTLEQFKEMQIDIVIASIPQHIEPFKKLAEMKGTKFIFQMGNVFDVNLHEIPNLMANSLPENIPSSCNFIQYHQEFDTSIFKPTEQRPLKQITSFINIYQDNGGFEDYITLKGMLPDFEFKSFGAQNEDGIKNTTSEIASSMQESFLGFHSKRMGDGYGHILYNWFACGKPIITRISDYKGKLGEELLENDVTCFDLDIYNYGQLCYIINNLHPDKYLFMTQQVQERFKEKVNFNIEFEEIKIFLKNLR